MSDIKRYDIYLDGCEDGFCMATCRKDHDDDGDWVRYEDHQAEVERLRKRITDPDDLRLVLDAAEYVVKEYDTGPEKPDMLAEAAARLRAALEEA